jgi:hypothetical protein
MRTIDLKFQEICDEVDRWKAEAEYWKKQYKKLQLEYHENINESIRYNYNVVGIALEAMLDPESTLNKNII